MYSFTAPAIFQSVTWLLLGAGAIMALAALRYQGRVWWPFQGDWAISLRESRPARWIGNWRRRRPRRARRATDLAQMEARQRRRQALAQALREITLARSAQIIAFLVTLVALGNVLGAPSSAILWAWEPVTDLHVTLLARLDDLSRGLVQLALAVMLLTVAAQSWSRDGRSARTRDYAWSLVAVAALIHTIYSWDLIAFLIGWVVLDIALLAGLIGWAGEKDTPLLVVSAAGSMVVTLALFWATLVIGPFEGMLFFSRASPILLEDRVLGMLLLAAVFRLTLYPFHLRFRHATAGSSLWAILGHFLPLVAGFYLLARLCALASGEMPGLGGVQMLGVFSLVAGAVLIWHRRDPWERLSDAFLSQVGGLVVVFTLGSLEAITATLVSLLSLVLAATGLFLLAFHPLPGHIGRPWVDRALRLMPLASLAGLPPFLGFWGLWMRLNVILEWHQPGLMLLILVSQISTLVALGRALASELFPAGAAIRAWDNANSSPADQTQSKVAPSGSATAGEHKMPSTETGGERTGRRIRVITWIWRGTILGLLSLPLLLLGLWPPALLAGLQATVALLAGVPAPTLSVTGLSPTADPLIPWLTSGALGLTLVAIVAGLGWGSWWRLPWRAGNHWLRVIGTVLDLAWAYRLGWWAWGMVSRLVAGLVQPLDGHYALAWVILLGLLLGLVLLGGEFLP